MEGHYVVAIDVGIKNLGICIFDFLTCKVVVWDCVSLVSNGKYIPSNNVDYIHEFVQRYRSYFDKAAKVLVERQMRCNMRIVEAVIHSLFYDRCIVISPRSVKLHYSLSTKNYRANKQKAVEWARQFLASNTHAFCEKAAEAFGNRAKRDDLADSLLLVMYYLDTYSNQCTTATISDIFNAFEDGGFIL